EEALQKWDKEKILSDVVWVIRRFRPDVIITRFPQDSRAGHGHHSASAVLAVEAFTAAADPNKFPEQLKYVKPWQAKRVVWNTFNFGGTNTTSSDQFTVDAGTFNPVLGKSYGEIAAESRSQHKSQGFGVARQRGAALEYFSLWKGEGFHNDLLEGVNSSWTRVKGGEVITQKINALLQSFSLFAPGKSVKDMVELYRMISALPDDGYWKQQKLNELQNLIEAASGLFADATTADAQVVQTDYVRLGFLLNNRNGNTIKLTHISAGTFDTALNVSLASNQNYTISKDIFIPAGTPVSQPYWLQQPMKEGHFEVNDQLLIGNADNAPALSATFVLNIEGQDFRFEKPVRQKYTDPVKGELYQPLSIVPPLVITPNKNLLLSATPAPQTARFTVRAMKDIAKPQVSISAPKGWQAGNVQYSSPDLLRKGQEMDVDVTLQPVAKDRVNGKEPLIATVEYDKHTYNDLLRTISYDHIPTLNYFKSSAVNVLTLDLAT
ncbi:MAG: PIG-L family deacetylase, partial [Bacteroidetes bacterium]|nr:PIG-L family deacetylase [Bacteroidota bacterium]